MHIMQWQVNRETHAPVGIQRLCTHVEGEGKSKWTEWGSSCGRKARHTTNNSQTKSSSASGRAEPSKLTLTKKMIILNRHCITITLRRPPAWRKLSSDKRESAPIGGVFGIPWHWSPCNPGAVRLEATALARVIHFMTEPGAMLREQNRTKAFVV